MFVTTAYRLRSCIQYLFTGILSFYVFPFVLDDSPIFLSPTNKLVSAVFLAAKDIWLNLPTDCLWRYFINSSKQSLFKRLRIITTRHSTLIYIVWARYNP